MKKAKLFVMILVLVLGAALATSCSPKSSINYEPSLDASYNATIVPNGNEYLEIVENPFVNAAEEPSSMFALSVSTAAYSNLRRHVNDNLDIVPNQINIEQIVNYFHYDYPEPEAGKPLSLTPSISTCPWNEEAHLLTIGLKAETVQTEAVRNNLVFLLDVSGSMQRPDKLGLMQQAFLLLLENLDQNDVVSIVTYAGSDRVLLDGANGAEKPRISGIIEELTAGGSTAGASGINTAYEIAEKHFIEGGNNRVLLATDGDFNVGISTPNQLESFISQKRENGVYLSALGFGYGNLQNDTMETLANNGNGNYAYIDSISEARKVLVEEIGGTLNIVAKDAKARVDFNPDYIDSYRLLGYENLLLTEDDWNNNETDAGEIGSGFTVTAVYEILFKEEADLNADGANYLDTAVRYKSPDANDQEQYEIKVGCDRDNLYETLSGDRAFISALVETSLLLRNSNYKGQANMENVIARLGTLDLSNDPYKEEFRLLASKIAEQYFPNTEE
ncbi:MAG: von Willebrand factor type A domain-containing protein [Clostridia bacterium]|nr:von Willebrand factor type A domain-containing protein [Clostridia bacterium]